MLLELMSSVELYEVVPEYTVYLRKNRDHFKKVRALSSELGTSIDWRLDRTWRAKKSRLETLLHILRNVSGAV